MSSLSSGAKKMRKLKIGFVFDDSLDKPDGVQQYVLILGRWLATQGHDVHYLVGETKRTDLQNLYSLARNVNVKFNQNRMAIPLPAKLAPIKEI
jgi:phosphatidylinositol alpha-mannosyltransferase